MYKGREGQWAFFLHRLSGLAILAYLLIHTISIGSVILGKDTYQAIHETYGLPFFRLGLIGVAGAVAYHAFNGLRIITMDFTAFGVKFQRQLWYGVLVLSVAVTGLAMAYNLPRIFDNDPQTRLEPTQPIVGQITGKVA
jgi:succinate dehydrogenase / fumarate reductase, cytochrome b subunit